jgi:hypothetical protein
MLNVERLLELQPMTEIADVFLFIPTDAKALLAALFCFNYLFFEGFI